MALSPEQQHVLSTILRIGQRRRVSPMVLKSAVETGLVESSLRNLHYGDADSQGWRQERASLYPNPTNLKASVNRYFDEATRFHRTGRYSNAGALAAAVQRPAAQYRGRYAQVGSRAESLLGRYGNGVPGAPGGGGGRKTRLSELVSTPGVTVNPPQNSTLATLLSQQGPPPVPISAPSPVAFGADRYLRGASAGQLPSTAPPVQQGGSLAEQLAGIQGSPSIQVPGSSQRVSATGIASDGRGPVGRTLVIGDSLEVGTFPLLKQKLGNRVQGVFVGGKPSSWGIQQLRRQFREGRFQNVVFDMGTNDATVGELRQSLSQLTKIAGGAKVYVSTVNSPWDEGAKNRLLRTYARNHPNVELIKWHGASHGGSILSDGIHGAYGKRANLIAGALGYDPRANQPATGAIGRGKVRLLPGADRPGASTRPIVKSFVAQVAGILGRPVTISTGTQHTQYVSGRPGVESDHWSGHGADLGSASNNFSVGGSGGDRLAAAAIRAATGMSQAQAMRVARAGGYHNFTPRSGPFKGRHIQVIWRAPDHYDHVHIGIK